MRFAKPEELFDLISHEDQQERKATLEKFPSAVVVEGSYPEMDNALRWCWNSFGPRHGKCGGWGKMEYTVCPIILATEFTEEVLFQGKSQIKKRYAEVPEHFHHGSWTDCWLAKTDYDYGYAEYYFNRGDALQSFIAQVPEITWGENYPSHPVPAGPSAKVSPLAT